MVFHVSGGIFILLSTFTLYSSIDDGLPGQYGIFLVLALLGRLSVTASFSAVLTYVPELFPTSVRNTGLGFSAASLYLGSTIAPHARTVSRHAPWAPNLVFGVLCLTVSMVIHFLPETSGQDLTQTVLEMDHRIQRRR
uniref:Major facilitator superfamily (MFS) profile domain-containing protein n=1 Tax=Biomphalaria glabrata TaxID=6526 RepID=A0A2C9LHS4_BIOGL